MCAGLGARQKITVLDPENPLESISKSRPELGWYLDAGMAFAVEWSGAVR